MTLDGIDWSRFALCKTFSRTWNIGFINSRQMVEGYTSCLQRNRASDVPHLPGAKDQLGLIICDFLILLATHSRLSSPKCALEFFLTDLRFSFWTYSLLCGVLEGTKEIGNLAWAFERRSSHFNLQQLSSYENALFTMKVWTINKSTYQKLLVIKVLQMK